MFYKKNCIDINNIKQLPKKTSNLIINYERVPSFSAIHEIRFKYQKLWLNE
jgi:hypothetical protein